MSEVSKLYTSILDGNAKEAAAVVQQALKDGCDPLELVANHMIPAMERSANGLSARSISFPNCFFPAAR